MRSLILLAVLLLAACGDRSEPAAQTAFNSATPPLETMSEKPGEWTDLDQMVGRTPMDSGLLDNSSVSIDLASALGPDLSSFRAAMMTAGPLTRVGNYLVTRSSEAWLVLDPADHAFHAGLQGPQGWREWQTAGADVPVPAGFSRAASGPASDQRER